MRPMVREVWPVLGEVLNSSGLERKEIMALDVCGSCRNNWRGRRVTLYRLAPGEVVSVGVPIDVPSQGLAEEGRPTVVALERDEDHRGTLAAFPSTHVYD